MSILIFLFVFLMPGIGLAQPVEVTYLGNEGFLIESGSQSVLIDGLFGSGLSGYPVVPQATREAMESASGKFADVDLILASHHHPDHFDARSVFLHLTNNPEARFFSTLQAVQKLQALENWKQIESRVQIATPPEGQSFSYEHSQIQILSYNLHHGKDTTRPVENIGWLIRIGGKELIHLGDTVVTAEEIAPLRFQEERIDIKFVPFWLFLDSNASKMMEQIPALHTIVMHIPEAAAPEEYFGDIKNQKNLLAVLQRQIKKQDWIPLQPNETRIFDAKEH